MLLEDANFVVDILSDETKSGAEEAEKPREFFISDHVLIQFQLRRSHACIKGHFYQRNIERLLLN